MMVFYHPDIITKLFGAFMTHSPDPDNAYKIIEKSGSSEVKYLLNDPNVINQKFGTYVTKALLNVIQNEAGYGSNIGISTKEYYPENMKEHNVSKMILQMCAKGKFIPFILTANKFDLHPIGDNDVLVIVAGIGENPCQNFIIMTINVRGTLNALHITSDFIAANENAVHMIYPIMFNAISNTIVSALPRNCVSIKTYLLAPQLNTDELTVIKT